MPSTATTVMRTPTAITMAACLPSSTASFDQNRCIGDPLSPPDVRRGPYCTTRGEAGAPRVPAGNYTFLTPTSGSGATHERRSRAVGRSPWPARGQPVGRSDHGGGRPQLHGDGVLRDGHVRLAYGDHADPQPVERAQRHDPRRRRPAGRAER